MISKIFCCFHRKPVGITKSGPLNEHTSLLNNNSIKIKYPKTIKLDKNSSKKADQINKIIDKILELYNETLIHSVNMGEVLVISFIKYLYLSNNLSANTNLHKLIIDKINSIPLEINLEIDKINCTIIRDYFETEEFGQALFTKFNQLKLGQETIKAFDHKLVYLNKAFITALIILTKHKFNPFGEYIAKFDNYQIPEKVYKIDLTKFNFSYEYIKIIFDNERKNEGVLFDKNIVFFSKGDFNENIMIASIGNITFYLSSEKLKIIFILENNEIIICSFEYKKYNSDLINVINLEDLIPEELKFIKADDIVIFTDIVDATDEKSEDIFLNLRIGRSKFSIDSEEPSPVFAQKSDPNNLAELEKMFENNLAQIININDGELLKSIKRQAEEKYKEAALTFKNLSYDLLTGKPVDKVDILKNIEALQEFIVVNYNIKN